MEVRLDAFEGQPLPKETFVSMRIGDVQKQARFSNSKTYRFPDPGDTLAGYGRIEVFQRIGTTTVKFDKSSGQFQEVEVPCEAPEKLTQLNLKLAVKGKQGEDSSVSKKSKVKSKLDAAQKYVAHHRLEEILADAMREVMRQKPDEPISFISAHIMKQVVPKEGTPSPPDQVLPLPGKVESVHAATETKSLDDVEATRTQAREALLRATRDGSLSASFTEAREVETIRTQAREGLLRAAGNGSLSAAFGKEKGTFDDVEAVRTQTKDALLRSAKDGTLSAALGQAKRSFDDVESIRAQTREALTRSANNGTLANAFKSASGDVDAIRADAREALLRSAESGKLSAVFGKSNGTTDIETLREQARQALLRSAQDGSLKASLAEAKGSSVATPENVLCARVRQALLRSAQDGSLKASLGEATGSSVATPLDVLRMKGREALLRSAQDGSLKAFLGEATKSSMATPVDVLRVQARDGLLQSARDETLQGMSLRVQAQQALLDAARDGTLRTLLGESLDAPPPPNRGFGRTEECEEPPLKAVPLNVAASKSVGVPFKDYYMTNIRPLNTSDLGSLYSKFPAQPKSAPSKLATSSKGQFALLPSVGTWLAKIPKPMSDLAAASRVSQPLGGSFQAYYAANMRPLYTSDLESLYSKFPARAKQVRAVLVTSAPEKLASSPSSSSKDVPFREYYTANFRTLQHSDFANLYSKFPSLATSQPKAVSSQLAVSPKRQFALLPSVGTWLAKVPKPMLAPNGSAPKQPGAPSGSQLSAIRFKDYYSANFQLMPADGFAKLHSKFPTKPRPETSGLAASAKTPFALLPSVGTWLAKVPKPMLAPGAAPAKTPFALLPSVGTWLGQVPKPMLAPGAAPAKTPFALLPSVGTWLAKVPKPMLASGACAPKQPGTSASQLSAIPFRKYYDANFQSMPADGFAKLHSKFPVKPKPNTSGLASVPKQPGAPSASQLSAIPFKKYYDANFQSMPADGFAKLYSKFPTKPKPDTSGLASVPKQPGAPSASQLSTIPFKKYYDANFQSMPADGFARLYSKFPTKPKPATSGLASVPKQPVAPSASQLSAIPFKKYYDANFQSVPADGFAKLYSKFPTKLKPATSGLASVPKQPLAPSASQLSAIPFKKYYDANFQSMPADGFARLYSKFPTKPKPATSGQARNIETNLEDVQSKVVSPVEVMKFDDIDFNQDGKIDRDEWEKAFVKANGEGGRIDRGEDDAVVVAKLQQTLSEKDKEIASLRELLKSSGHGDQLRRLEY